MSSESMDGTPAPVWPLWQRVLFRFLFVYMLLQVAPWNWLGRVPGTRWITSGIYGGINGAVYWANAHLFHTWPVLVPTNGSGDTSWAWTQFWLYLVLAALACLVWSVADRRRPAYPWLAYWFRTGLRFYIATYALSYGIIKLFLAQMPFPTLSQMATPLGDFLPMRVSWMFIGYSSHYEFFSGAAETIAGLLLLYRPTVTLGLLAAAGAFTNVVMINLSYDVPVKLFASHLLFACVVLLAMDSKRLMS
ncbi:MAG TPA: hypothetical protein VE967_06990, partial [Gemmatimonadaceae bacterium]|nr:hypothetical protein [Gemmatimonadaceae bacterium]